MRLALIAALVLVDPMAAPTSAQQASAITYHSAKTLEVIQKCLTEKLAALGEVVALPTDKATTTLVLRDVPDVGPMTIDLAPPTVTVTSKPTPHTRHLIKACL
jgi:hypothetical protein